MKDFDSSLLQAIQDQTIYLESSWFGIYRLWKRNNFLQKYSFAAMSSMICGETSDPQHRELPDIIQRLRQVIPIFDSLVSILTVTKSELTWQMHDVVSLSQITAPDVIHQPPLDDIASEPPSPLLTTLVPDNIDIFIPLVSSPSTVTNLEIYYSSLSDKFRKLSDDYSSLAFKFMQLDVDQSAQQVKSSTFQATLNQSQLSIRDLNTNFVHLRSNTSLLRDDCTDIDHTVCALESRVETLLDTIDVFDTNVSVLDNIRSIFVQEKDKMLLSLKHDYRAFVSTEVYNATLSHDTSIPDRDPSTYSSTSEPKSSTQATFLNKYPINLAPPDPVLSPFEFRHPNTPGIITRTVDSHKLLKAKLPFKCTGIDTSFTFYNNVRHIASSYNILLQPFHLVTRSLGTC